MLNIQTFAIGLLAAAVACGGSYIKGRNDGRKIEVAERATLEEVARAATDAAVTAAAGAIAKISITHTTIRQKAEVQIREKPVYRDCITTPDVVGLLDAARAGQSAPESASDSGVPGPGASKP